jgi:hypothetical protein
MAAKLLLTHAELKSLCDNARKTLETTVLEVWRRRMTGSADRIEEPIAQALAKQGAEVRGRVRIRKVYRNGMRAIATVFVRIHARLRRVAIGISVLLLQEYTPRVIG